MLRRCPGHLSAVRRVAWDKEGPFLIMMLWDELQTLMSGEGRE